MSEVRAMEGKKLLMLWRRMCSRHKQGILGRLHARFLRTRILRQYGCHISPLSRPKGWINLPHPTGIVVGHDVEINDGVTLYHNVTLGQSGRGMGYPIIEKGATIYAGAVVIGSVRIGEGSCIGANSVVTQDVPSGATAVGAPARVLKCKAE